MTTKLRRLIHALEHKINKIRKQRKKYLQDELQELIDYINKERYLLEEDNSDIVNPDDSLILLRSFKSRLQNNPRLFEIISSEIDPYISFLEELQEKNYEPKLIKELYDIENGLYQEITYLFTYNKKEVLYSNGFWHLPTGNKENYRGYFLHGLLNLKGLRCTVAIPEIFDSSEVEIHINFFGTVDFNSLVCDVEKGAPGHKTIQKHEVSLVKQIHSIIQQLTLLYPDHKFRLRLNGHSLGGTLAKNCSYILQRAIAVQENFEDEIIERIEQKLSNHELSQDEIEDLRQKLSIDKNQFEGFEYLQKITGITVYAWGAPGVSKEINKLAILMTYFYNKDFIRIYNHFHAEDIIPKFGEIEFLIPEQNGIPPNILINQTIQYSINLTQEEINKCGSLPFPECNKNVMAAHTKRIYSFSEEEIQSEKVDAVEKIKFSFFEKVPYKAFYFFGKSSFVKPLSKILPIMQSWETFPDLHPNIRALDYDFLVGEPNIYNNYSESNDDQFSLSF